jgi:Uma2 family endonuclease
MALAREQLTLEEFLRLPEQKPALEYTNGGVSQKVSPKGRHSAVQSELLERINAVARPAGMARALPELRATFGGASVVPDVSVFRKSRIPRDDAGAILDDVAVPPDIAIEIASPSQSSNALFRRCRWYVSNGAEIALLVDPVDRSVLAFLPDGGVVAWSGEDVIDLGAVIPGLHLTAEQLFSTLDD